jgi:vacuolar-type H+-ATPase subunit C/Vma6
MTVVAQMYIARGLLTGVRNLVVGLMSHTVMSSIVINVLELISKRRRYVMTRDELLEFLEDCPTHKWEIVHEDNDYVVVSFPVIEMEDAA